MDKLTVEQRHKVMSHIKSKDTSIEIALRKALWHSGIHYRKNYKFLPGTPDIALTKYKIAIFCDSEFFHGFQWEEKKKHLGNNREYWIKKIDRNIARDSNTDKALAYEGWTVIHFWGHEILQDVSCCVDIIKDTIFHTIMDQYSDANISHIQGYHTDQ